LTGEQTQVHRERDWQENRHRFIEKEIDRRTDTVS